MSPRSGTAATLEGFHAGYLQVDGLPTWQEVGGEGPPLVLLHGAFSGAAAWTAQAPALARAGFGVRVPERRGHAHTRDVEGPLTYTVMAQDTASYLETALDGPAHLVGWSDGAVVALLVALERPELVDKLVLIGQYYNSSGKVPGSQLEQLLGSEEAMRFLRQGYDPFSPDGPEHFEVVRDKTIAMIATEPELDLAVLGGVRAPTLVLQGDRDEVTLAHSMAVVDALQDGRLAVLPGTHALPIEQPEVVNVLIASFLRDGAPAPAWGSP